MEVQTNFSERIKKECGIYDLQGICKNRNGDYTIAIEAVDMGNDPVEAFWELFSEDELYAKAKFAERVGATMYLMLHKREKFGAQEEKHDEIYCKTVSTANGTDVVVEDDVKLSEDYFVQWWKKRKAGAQRKEYGDEMKRLIRASYFDTLLERKRSSWPGNIDGFMMRDGEISSIIECRFSSDFNISSYDPNQFFADDKKVWGELYKLSTEMEVPLYLFTYSRRMDSREKVGIAKIENITSTGLVYKDNIKPCNNLKSSSYEVLDWISKNP